jgi:hypothetical protein
VLDRRIGWALGSGWKKKKTFRVMLGRKHIISWLKAYFTDTDQSYCNIISRDIQIRPPSPPLPPTGEAAGEEEERYRRADVDSQGRRSARARKGKSESVVQTSW